GSYDFTALVPFISKLREGYHLVMGNRFVGGIKPGAMPALHRYFGNPVLTGIARLLFRRPPCRDFHCGLRGLSRAAAQQIDLRTTGMEFASEMVVKATLHGMRIAEVPITLSPDGRNRPPHLRSWRDGWRHLRFLLLYSPRWLFLYPGAFLMLLGLAVLLALSVGPITIGAIRFDIHTLLCAASALLIGLQAGLFAVFAKVFAIAEGLLPEDSRLKRASRYVTLETGLLLGSLLLLVGVLGSIEALRSWEARSFGPLDASR